MGEIIINLMKNKITNFKKNEHGGTSLVFAIGLPVIIGSVGFMTELGFWRMKKADLQATADMAAIAAAYEFTQSEDKTRAKRAAFADANANMFEGTVGQLVTNIPPVSGQFAGENAVQVSIEQEIPTFFSGIFMKNPPRAKVTAVAKLGGNSVEACVLALASHGQAISIGGSVEVSTAGCGLHANSTGSPAINVWGAAEIDAACMSSSGTTQISGSKPKSFSDCPQTGLSHRDPVEDPYADLDVPINIDSEPCQSATITGKGSKATMSFPAPGSSLTRICDSHIDIRNRIELDPGIYVFDGTELDFGNGGFIAGDDVTLIFRNNAELSNINGGNGFDISAPTSGDYQGIAIYADRNTMSSNSWRINGNADMSVYGAIYLPTLDIEYTGGAGTNATECTQLIAQRVSFTGNSGFNNNCDPIGTRDIIGPGEYKVSLVE